MKDKINSHTNVVQKRKTLSLNLDKKMSKQNSDKVGQVFVEVKKKRSKIYSHSGVERRIEKEGEINSSRSGKLTDAEFKARVKALQNAISSETLAYPKKSTVTENVTDTKVTLTTPKVKAEIKTDTTICNSNNNNENNKNCEPPTSKKISEEKQINTNIIEKLIKISPKNKQSDNMNIKPVVFRSEHFIKKSRPVNAVASKQSDAQNIVNKSERTTRVRTYSKDPKNNADPQAKRNEKRVFSSSKKNVNNGTDYSKKNDNKVLPNKVNVFEFNSRTSSAGFSTKDKTPQKPKFKTKSRFNENEKDFSLKEKGSVGKFGKRDLELAMNDNASEHQRSVASVKRSLLKAKKITKPTQKITREINIPDSITVGDLANRMAVKSSEVVKYLMSVGTMATINQIIDGDVAEIVCTSFGHIAKRIAENAFEKELDYSVLDTEENSLPRSPIVAVMGHVDHGKTTLLDTLRQTSATKKEAGGITQHVAAYQVAVNSDKSITFIDTPGHAAFSNIRERGAYLTDIIVLVVAADDGVKEQTVEVIRDAQKHKVPMVVAINKIDRAGADIERVKSELMRYEVVSEDFGGDVLCVGISAKNNTNLDKLLEAILLQAEILNLKANPDRKANCTVLETRMEKGRGIVASVIVNGGTLNTGDIFVAGTVYGKIRTMTDCMGNRVKSCIPAVPIEITGFDGAPEPGDLLVVVDNEQKAREISAHRKDIRNKKLLVKRPAESVNEIIAEANSSPTKKLNVYLKADVYGSLEAVETSLMAIKSPDIEVSVVGKNIGIVSESDIDFAKASNAIVVCFNVGVSAIAKSRAKALGIKIITGDIIYRLTDEIVELMESMLPSIIEEKYTGEAIVKKLFFISRLGTIAGCLVTDGIVKKNNCKMKVTRGNHTIYEGEIKSMKHEKDEIKECGLNKECGILTENFNDYEEGDVIECYEIMQIRRRIKR